MTYKRRPRNKQELSSKSGKRVRKILPKKTIVEFEFSYMGKIYKNGDGARLKIMDDGGISCLITWEDRWMPVKATLEKIKMKTVIIKDKIRKK
jgi:hypothetical protein